MEMVQWDSWEEGPSNLKNNEEMQYSALMYKSLLIWKCFVNIDSKLYEATLDNANINSIYTYVHTIYGEARWNQEKRDSSGCRAIWNQKSWDAGLVSFCFSETWVCLCQSKTSLEIIADVLHFHFKDAI